MHRLRTVTVLEHEIIPVIDGHEERYVSEFMPRAKPYLTEEEAQALAQLNDLRAGLCQRMSGGVKLAQYCGIVRLQTCVIELLPKVGLSDTRTSDELAHSRAALLTMLHNARELKIARVGEAPQQAVHAPLLDIFIEAFLQRALEQARRGLLARYVTHADDLPVIKGRFRAREHLHRNLGRPYLLHCEYDEFTVDNPYNRAIRATLDVCRGWTATTSTQRLWFEAHTRFASVSSIRVTSADVARLPRERLTRRYEPVLTWCEWLLAMASPAMNAGSVPAPGLLFDMNKLFEAYVSNLEELASGNTRIVYRQGPIEPLAAQGNETAFPLKPDITVWHATPDGSPGAIDRVLDAKWKRLDPQAAQWGVDQADVYQALAYALRYQCQRLELVYPMPGSPLPKGESPPIFEIASSDFPNVYINVRLVPISPPVGDAAV